MNWFEITLIDGTRGLLNLDNKDSNMVRFFKIFTTLLIISLLAIGIYYYFNNNTNSDNVEDKTNIENTVKSETSSNESIEGTVVAKRSTENK